MQVEEIRKALNNRGFGVNLYKYNSQYANIPDELLCDFVRLRMSNDGWGAPIRTINIIEKKNKTGEYFYLKFILNDGQAFEHVSGIMFKKFYTNEVDWLSECFELLHFLPMSEYIFRQNNAITNLECSNRGWLSAAKSWKDAINKLSESMHMPS